MKFYIDDPEVGLARETSHPDFVKHFTDDFYYDCADDFSPFGNDDGADTLFALQDWYEETSGKGSIMNWLFEYIDAMGFEYSSKSTYQTEDINIIQQLQQEDEFFLRSMDNTILAAAFGQYKIAGKLDPKLKEAAIIAFKRLKLITTGDNTPYLDEFNKTYGKMQAALLAAS